MLVFWRQFFTVVLFSKKLISGLEIPFYRLNHCVRKHWYWIRATYRLLRVEVFYRRLK